MPGAGVIGGGDYGSDAYTRSMRLMAMGDILKGGNGGAYYNYMQQLAAAQQADARFAAQQAAIEEQRNYERAMAEQAAAEQQAMLEAAQAGMSGYFGSLQPNPVRAFNNNDPEGFSVAADAMAYVKPELFPGLSRAAINDAARNGTPASSALVSMFYNMPDDVADSTRAGYDDGTATFAYNDQEAREWARKNAPEYGFGFEGVGPEAKFEAQQSMPTPLAPERLAQIMTNPMVPDEVKDMVLARFGGANSDMKWIDGIGMVDMNNPPTELMAGQYQAPAEPRTMQVTGSQLIAQFGVQPGAVEPNALYNVDPDGKISRIGGAGTTVNVGPQGPDYGDPDKGYVWALDEAGQIMTEVDPETGYRRPIQVPKAGGQVEADQAAAATAAQSKQDRQNLELSIVLDETDRIISKVEGDTEIPFFGSTTTGLAGGALSKIPSTEAGAVSGMLTTLRAYTAYDKLQAIRDASPTGGAVGQVSNYETRLMAAILGELEQSRNKEQFLYNMNRFRDTMRRIADEGIPDEEAQRMLSTMGTQADPLGIR